MHRTRAAAAALLVAVGALALPACTKGSSTGTATVTVDLNHGRPLATFSPYAALGAGLDGQDQGSIAGMYAPPNLATMKSAGLKPVTYRLRTELADEAWHWNPTGTWSDAGNQQGYWTSATTATTPIDLSYGYRLPRRGNTQDQADNSGYSRIDDGDPATFWKSNPYLDAHYTGEDPAAHPQWVIVDLGQAVQVDAARLAWGTPFATRFTIQYWTGQDDPFSITSAASGNWKDFAQGALAGTGGDQVVKLASTSVATQFVRVLMTQSSGQAPVGSTDVRDGLGYALRELSIGTQGSDGVFHDRMRHGAGGGVQSQVYVSSTDPWHRASDIDQNTEQPGFDRVLASGLLNDLPAVVPVPLLFGTPEDAVAELRFLAARGFKVGRVELGEEPDGQNVLPEDYGALYVQWARALREVDPAVQLGGPSLQTGFQEVRVWADATGETAWLKRLNRFFTSQNASDLFNFLSVEWYPFDDACSPPAPNLAQEPAMLTAIFRQWAADGLGSLPKLVTEYGYSAQATRPEVDLEGALLNADFAAQFLALGGTASYLYGYEPNILLKEPDCTSWGNNMLLLANNHLRVRAKLATYYAARMITSEWAQPVDAPHQVYRATFNAGKGNPPVSAYAVHRPDGKWAILIVDRDPNQSFSVNVRFIGAPGAGNGAFRGTVRVVQLGRVQYQWRANGDQGYPLRSLPPAVSTQPAPAAVDVRPYSISVVVGAGPAV